MRVRRGPGVVLSPRVPPAHLCLLPGSPSPRLGQDVVRQPPLAECRRDPQVVGVLRRRLDRVGGGQAVGAARTFPANYIGYQKNPASSEKSSFMHPVQIP